jgi:hypothetical protein
LLREVDVVKMPTMIQRLILGVGWLLLGLSVAMAQVQNQETTAPQSDNLVSQGETTGVGAVQAVVDAVGASSAQALLRQIQIGNVMEEGLAASLAVVRDSFQNNRGIIGANQNTGNLNNQANVQVIAHVSGGPTIRLGEATVEQRLVNNTIVTSGAARKDLIENSFGGTVGIIGINQSAGNLNNQANVVVFMLGKGSGFVALEDSSLGKVNTGNKLIPGPAGPKSDVITGSFAGFRGLAQVSQSAGDLNQVSNTMHVSLFTK